jgi:oxaloacetate decarboxylase alpha subunit
MCCYEAIKLGIRSINTAIPPLANGSSNPSLFTVARNARALGYRTAVDEALLQPVASHFNFIAKREGFAPGEPREYDSYHYRHQVPGGMISNFRFQLGKLGMAHRIGEVLEEVARVRRELGYPIMVTPYSQFVGVQAAMNVILGARYKECTDEVIQYALGTWGEDESSSIDANVKDRILDRPRARELKTGQAPELTLQQFRVKLAGPGVSDDELLLRYFAGKEDVERMKGAAPVRPYLSGQQPLVLLIQELSKKKNLRQVVVRRGELAVRLERQGSAGSA